MSSGQGKKKILIVDDSKTTLRILVEALKKDYDVSVATDGGKAIEYVNKKLPDLVLLDIIMGEMDGYEVCARIMGEEKTRNIPILFMTRLISIEDKVKGFSLGAVDYITKPFDIEEVRARVHTHISMKKKLDTLLDELDEKHKRKNAEFRKALVEVMILSLHYWEQSTQKIKADLADQSGIWTASIGAEGSYRTRTLDKYLSLNTLPKKPRWRDVLRTGYFVLQKCPNMTDLKKKLEAKISQVETMLRGYENE